MTVIEWITDLRTWIASHARLPYEADDSRESIYDGCGECHCDDCEAERMNEETNGYDD
jgi:hypothetical protein